MSTFFHLLQTWSQDVSKFGWKNRAKIVPKSNQFFHWFFIENPSKNVEKRWWLLKPWTIATWRAFGTAFWAPGSILGKFWGPLGVHFSTTLATCFEQIGRFRLIGCSWGSEDAPGSIFSQFWVDLGSILDWFWVDFGFFLGALLGTVFPAFFSSQRAFRSLLLR